MPNLVWGFGMYQTDVTEETYCMSGYFTTSTCMLISITKPCRVDLQWEGYYLLQYTLLIFADKTSVYFFILLKEEILMWNKETATVAADFTNLHFEVTQGWNNKKQECSTFPSFLQWVRFRRTAENHTFQLLLSCVNTDCRSSCIRAVS